jgi:hypothetical protein
MSRRVRRWVLAGLLMLLAVVAGAAEQANPVPLEVGTSRFYHTQRKFSFTINSAAGKQSFPFEVTGDVVERATGTDATLFGAPVTILEARATETNPMGQVRTTTTTSYLSARPDGLYLSGVRFAGLDGVASGELTRYEAPLVWLKLPLQPGAKWNVGKLKLDGIDAVTTAEVAGTEDVTVPAGTYKGCTKVIYRHTQLAGQLNLPAAKATVESGQGTTTLWLAPGVGPVKETAELTGVYVIRPESQPGVEVKADVVSQKTRELSRMERGSKSP